SLEPSRARGSARGPTRRRLEPPLDEARQARDGGERVAVHLVALDLDAEFFLERHHQLEGVDRVEAQPFTEERLAVLDRIRVGAVQMEAVDDETLDPLAKGRRHADFCHAKKVLEEDRRRAATRACPADLRARKSWARKQMARARAPRPGSYCAAGQGANRAGRQDPDRSGRRAGRRTARAGPSARPARISGVPVWPTTRSSPRSSGSPSAHPGRPSSCRGRGAPTAARWPRSPAASPGSWPACRAAPARRSL